jgi:hypothetical protein
MMEVPLRKDTAESRGAGAEIKVGHLCDQGVLPAHSRELCAVLAGGALAWG